VNDFEYLLCALLIPIVYVLTYIAGKYDLLGIICRMLEEKAKGVQNGMGW
jgi:hypothetical protein